MRVVMVCPYDLSRPGGVQGQAVGLARALRRSGHEVAVVAPGPTTRGDAPFDGTHRVGGSVRVRSNGSVAPVAVSPMAARRVARLVGASGADVVHLHEPLAPVAGYACLLAPAAPLVGTYHRSGSSRWYRALGPVVRWADGRLDVRVAVSEAAAATAAASTGRDYEVAFNGVEVDRFADALPHQTDVPTVLFLGRHEERKGLGVLLDAFGRIGVPARLWVAGDGPGTAELRRRWPESERITWLGLIDDDEVARRLAGAHVLCAPSLRGESFGMVLLEAMAARCTVVASDLPGYRDAAGGHAVLVAPGDPDALARALTGALVEVAEGDPSRADRLGAALVHAEAWSMDRLAARYQEFYAAAAAHRGRRADG